MRLMGIFLIVFCSCHEQNDCHEQICITDTRLIGEWKLFQECLCYHHGGDFVWKPVSEGYIWEFNEQCIISETGEGMTTCNSGNYSIKVDKLSVKWICSDTNSTSAEYQFTLSTNGDTLTIKGFVDEGYIGQKFIKKG